jgi:transcriptional regulator with XRE-family HTH domain
MAAERARHDLKMSDVSDALGISVNTYQRWEQGTSAPGSIGLMAISKFYGCDPDYLLKETGPKDDFLAAARKRISI